MSVFDDLFEQVLKGTALQSGSGPGVRVVCRACGKEYGAVEHSCALLERDYRPLPERSVLHDAYVKRLQVWGFETLRRRGQSWAPGWAVAALVHEPMDPEKRDAFVRAALKDSDLRAAAEAAHRLSGPAGVAALIWEHEG